MTGGGVVLIHLKALLEHTFCCRSVLQPTAQQQLPRCSPRTNRVLLQYGPAVDAGAHHPAVGDRGNARVVGGKTIGQGRRRVQALYLRVVGFVRDHDGRGHDREGGEVTALVIERRGNRSAAVTA